MDVPKIANLSELLNRYLGQHKTIIDLETTRLTAIGENYGSQMLALKIHVKNKDQTEILEVVAKLPPPGEFIRRMFNVPVTFRNEVEFYGTIIPEMEAFLHERGLDGYLNCFPKLFGARLSLQGNDEVDDDAVLVLENLKVQGYEMLDRTVGFDYDSAKTAIKAIAKYHAVPLGLKLLKPEIFKKIRALFPPYKVFEFNETTFDEIVALQKQTVEDIEGCQAYGQAVADVFKLTARITKSDPKLIREPFATLIHTDTWVNNFMVKYQDGKPVGCKLVDFQLGEYGSPARDVIFFIFTSIQTPVVEEHYDDLIALYHQTLVGDLAKFGCDPTPFSMDELQKEIELAAREYEIAHCIMMLQPIFATKENLKELDEYKDEDMTTATPISDEQKEKTKFLVHEFAKRKWI